jgi:hypothetical protein
VPTSKFIELACEDVRHSTLYRCVDCGQLIELIDEERAPRMIAITEAFGHYMMSRIWPLKVAVLECKKCRCKIDIETAILTSPYSWPRLHAFWYECSGCGTGNHIRIAKGFSSIIEIIGVPGPQWETLETCRTEGLDMAEDPECLNVSIGSFHRAIPARK